VWTTFDESFEFSYEPKITDYGWHPSGHCTPSILELYDYAKPLYLKAISVKSFSGLPPASPLPASTRKSFIVGHYWHQVLQHIVCNKLHWCGPEDLERKGIRAWGDLSGDTFQPFHFATGSGDIVPCVAPNWTGIVDIKTMSANQFKQNGIPAWAADKYECQMNIYMDFFDQDNAIILAVNKDGPHDFKEFMFQRNQDLIDTIYGKWEFVSHCLDIGEAPTEEDDLLFPIITKGPTI
jgi:hypothetical protein